ncbi:hypothetical protein ACNJPG_03220 [Escherichia coli]|uniref:hypothetical protein n=1 Tax=Escherichia coli TaxID=562 RepID=UPI003A844CC8
MAISWIQPSFAGGEIGPSLYGRIDMAKYQVALRKCDNFIVRQYGGVENRPGTRFVGAAKYPNRKCRLIPFQFSTVQTYALEFGHQYMRVIKDGALVLNSSNVIYEIATPYTEADLFRIKFTQSADVLTLVHPAYPPKELRRYAHDNWQLVDVVTKNGPFEDINIDESVTVYASASTGTITLTASASIFGAEQVGKLFYLEQPAVDSVPVWETSKSTSIGDIRRADSNYYRAVSEMANQYDVLDRQAIAIDAVLGVAFGGVGRFINSRGESTSAPNFSPVDVDAALAANAAHHAEIDIAPGVPINVLSRNSHIQALRKAMSDVSQGRPVDVASIVESASFSEIPGRKSLLSQAVNEALSSVDDGVTARAIENRLLEEQAAQLLPRGDRQVYQSEIANSQRIIENLTEQRAQILAEEPTGSGKALSRARSDKQARLRDIDQRIRQAQERLEFSRNALAPHEPGGQFFEARAELARRQQAESELNAQAVSFYKTAEVRTPDEVAPFEPGKILQQTEQKMMADPAGDIDLRIAEDSLLESPDMIITVLDDDGNPQSRSAREVLDEANRESEQAIQDSSLFDVAVACFLRG